MGGALGPGVVDASLDVGDSARACAGGQGDAVHEGLVVGAQRLQEGDQVREGRVLQQGADIGPAAQIDGDDQGGLLVGSGRLAKAAADALHGVDDAVAGVNKDDGVDVGHVDALVEDAHVGQHRTGPVGICEVLQQIAAPFAGLPGVDRSRPQVFDPQFLAGLEGGGRQGGGEGLGQCDTVVEEQDAAQSVLGDRAQDGDLHGGVAQPLVVGGGVRAALGEDRVQVLVLDDGHEDLVVGQDAPLDRLRHAQFEHGRAEDLPVVHGGQRDAFHERHQFIGGRSVPDAGRGGHVEADLGGDLCVIVDGAPAVTEGGTGAVGLVGDHQVPGAKTVIVMGVPDAVQRVVSGEYGDRAAHPHRPGDRPRVAGHHSFAR